MWDKCILKRYIPVIEHMSDKELMKDFGLKQKNVVRLRSRINHVVEEKNMLMNHVVQGLREILVK